MAPDLALSAHLFAYEPLRFDHLKEAAEAGFRKIELWAMTPNFDVSDGARLKTLKGRLEDLSLTTPSFHAPFYADLSEAREWTLALSRRQRAGCARGGSSKND